MKFLGKYANTIMENKIFLNFHPSIAFIYLVSHAQNKIMI